MNRHARAESIKTEMVWTQQRAMELEGQMAELGAQERKATEKLRKMKEDRDKEIAELKAKEDLANKSAIEVYKSSGDFQEFEVQATSKYFGKGFDLCKKQVLRLHPELDIQDMEIDDELAWEEYEGEDKKEKDKDKDKEEGDQDNKPLSPYIYI